MEGQELADRFKLDITVLSNDRSKEVVLKPSAGQHLKQERLVIIWTRKYDLTERVYVEESPRGELRVVKRVAWRDKSVINYRSELDVLGRLSKATGTQKKLFVNFIGWFPISRSDHVCFVMEYCRLGDVSQCYPNPLPEAATRSICEQLLEALAILHELGITHRDVKPQNILVVEKIPIWVKLADFGISKPTQDGTELRTRIGTEGYMAPEVFGLVDDWRESSSYTSAVDVWSLGCLLYYVLTKRTPFSTFLSLQAYAKGDAGFPETPLYDKGVSLSGRVFIQRLLLRSPEARPKASKQLLATWITDTKVIPDSPSALVPDDPVDRPTRQSSSHENILSKSKSGPTPVPVPPSEPEMDYFSSELWYLIDNSEHLIDMLEASATRKTPQGSSGWEIAAANDAKIAAKAHVEYLIKINKLPNPNTDRLRALLDQGANPNLVRKGYTALHLATIKGYLEWVKVLLQYGGDLKIRTKDLEHTVLHLATLAMRQGHCLFGSRMVDFLLDQGADPNIPNVVGHTLLHELIRVAALFKTAPYNLDLIRWQIGNLMKRGVSTELKNLGGHTPLSYAIASGLNKIAIVLLENGSKPDTVDSKGRTPLHLAVASDKVSTELVRRLIKAGASINQEDMQKCSPLLAAARYEARGEIIGILLDCGAVCEFEDAAAMKRIRHVKAWRKFKGNFFNSG